MEKWFRIWEISDNPKICLYLARPSPTSKTLVASFPKMNVQNKYGRKNLKRSI